MFAVAGVELVPPSVELTELMVLVQGATCACAPVTETGKLQFPPAASVPPVSEITFAFTVTVPPQPAPDAFGALTPAGSESVNATPPSAAPAFGLVIVIVSSDVCPTTIGDVPNPLATSGGLSAAPTVSVSVAELLPDTGSVKPAGTATVAVLDSDPDADGDTVPWTVNVAVPPFIRFTADVLMLPVPDAGQLLPALAAQVHVTPVIAAGIMSVTVAPLTANGPLLITTIVYVIGAPGTAVNEPSVFVIARSAVRLLPVQPGNLNDPMRVCHAIVFASGGPG